MEVGSIFCERSIFSFFKTCMKYSKIVTVFTRSSSKIVASSSIKALNESLGVSTSTSREWISSLLYIK